MNKAHLNIDRKPLVIAGPCSAETEEQVLETARALMKQPVDIFRAGIWKPRTRPNSFEGVGEEGLVWLEKVKAETGLPVAVEVANAKHVALALKHHVDVLWIGARTTVSPFAVQEIADAVTGHDVTIMVKNPINPDVQLWIGAIERFQQAGVKDILAIHRGFSNTNRSQFRNEPMWELALEFKKHFPSLSMICDPSHICGVRHLIPEVIETALELEFDGLMIESHPKPEIALSDAKQQLTPDALGKILEEQLKKYNYNRLSLENLREKITELDEYILNAVAERMNISKSIGKVKLKNKMAFLQADRWQSVLSKQVEGAKSKGLQSEFVQTMYALIHEESLRCQQELQPA